MMIGHTPCSVKRSSSVSSAKVVSRTPARVAPIALAQASAVARARPEASWATATYAGTPRPCSKLRRTFTPSMRGATMITSTKAGGRMSPKWML